MLRSQFRVMVVVLWRDPWLKPITNLELDIKFCKSCNELLNDMDIVTSCEFCEIDIMHDFCANKHIFQKHKTEIKNKIKLHKERRLHDYQ